MKVPTLSHVFLAIGSVAAVLAVVGLFLPLLPATPFLLLAAFFFARGSQRWHNWLLRHRWFGPAIDNWQSGRGITARAKATNIILMGVSMGGTGFFIPSWPVRVGLFTTFVAVSCFLLSRPTAPRSGSG